MPPWTDFEFNFQLAATQRSTETCERHASNAFQSTIKHAVSVDETRARDPFLYLDGISGTKATTNLREREREGKKFCSCSICVQENARQSLEKARRGARYSYRLATTRYCCNHEQWCSCSWLWPGAAGGGQYLNDGQNVWWGHPWQTMALGHA